jgi:hypothetical protein
VEKHKHANATLRARSREANRTAKQAAARIAQLEDRVAKLERQVPERAAPANQGNTLPTKGRPRRRRVERDSRDAVPPGVSVEEPPPLDEEAETTREKA